MKIIIAGSRDFSNYQLLRTKADKITKNVTDVTVVSGEARGADQLGIKWAEERAHTVIKYPAEWDKYGKSAGYKRNEAMAAVADALIAFWDGKSRGTQHMIRMMKDKPTRVVYFK